MWPGISKAHVKGRYGTYSRMEMKYLILRRVAPPECSETTGSNFGRSDSASTSLPAHVQVYAHLGVAKSLQKHCIHFSIGHFAEKKSV
mmetsp:Transcript_56401/g.168809  ORF Transcript_56401/g.168809 Transcript_56401/m.168809 type:complete len:88 (+) Transcript_56401:142-405(+)